jgi:integrase
MKTISKLNLTKPEATSIATVRNFESGSKVAAESGSQPRSRRLASWSGRWSNMATDHTKRWEKRLYVAKSGGVELGKLAVRIQHLGQRDEFRFDTTNRAVAAVQALEIFRFLKANGWEATLAKFKPEGNIKLQTTIGDYLDAVRNLNKLRPRTFLNYQSALRILTADALGVKEEKGVSKYDYRSKGEQNGHNLWVAKIDGHRLDELTVEVINAWKRNRIARAGNSPTAIASAKRTVSSYIRCARSLFSSDIRKEIKTLTLPAVLPFAGVELESAGSSKYVSKINAQELIAAARKELKATEPEAYKAFLLGLFAGLRKAEIDLLEWRMLDYDANLIRLEQTEWLHLKTNDSAAEITIDQEVLAELRAYQPAPSATPAQWSQFILVSDRPPRPESVRAYYRCLPTFERLNAWLRSKGIGANKPLHELRKELGALIVTEHGIYAASRFLRHSDISTTARHYADQKTRITVGLGKYLGTTPLPSAPAADKKRKPRATLSKVG